MRYYKAFFIVLSVLIVAGGSFAQSKVGTTAAPFLTIGIGSRPQAMGGAFVAVADDAHALYWNPAGLARLNQAEMVFVHTTWLADTDFEYVGGFFPMGQMGALGASVTMLNYGEMEQTTESFQDGTGIFFDSYDLAASLSYSYKFYDKFSIGANLKYIRQVIMNETATGYGLDLGSLLITPFHDIRLGMIISNFGTKMQMEGRDLYFYEDPDENRSGNNDRILSSYNTDEWNLPLTLRLGLAGELLDTRPNRITLAADWVVPNDNSEYISLGTEYAYREFVFLRGGLRAIRPSSENENVLFEEDNGGGFTFGAGTKLSIGPTVRLVVDYAFESYDRLGNTHKYSLGLQF